MDFMDFGLEDIDISEVDMDELQKNTDDPVKDYFEQDYDSDEGDVKTEGELIEDNLDPVSATESYIRRELGISARSLEEIEEETVAEGEEIIDNGGVGEEVEYDYTDDDADTVDGEEISEDISIDDETVPEDGDGEDSIYAEDETEFGSTQSDAMEVAAESFRHIMLSQEDDGEDTDTGSGKLEVSLKGDGFSKDITIDGGSVSISDGDSSSSSEYEDDGNVDDDDDDKDSDDDDDDEKDSDDDDDDKSGESVLFDFGW